MTSAPANPPPHPPPSAGDAGRAQHDGTSFAQGALFGALLAATMIGVLVWFLWQPTPAPMTLTPPQIQEKLSPQASAPPTQITIHVSGAVVAPGLYELPVSARFAAAIEAAGGYAPDANTSALNLAAVLQDGERLHVPDITEIVEEPQAGISASPALVTGVDLADAELAATGPVNINNATSEQLQTLPGIGAVKAQAIIDSRPFASVDDLDRVAGIGPATIEELRAIVTID